MNMNINAVRRDYHVVPSGVYWGVRQEGMPHLERIVLTKTEAMSFAIEQARAGQVSLVEHGRDGQIQSVRSYDNFRGPDIEGDR